MKAGDARSVLGDGERVATARVRAHGPGHERPAVAAVDRPVVDARDRRLERPGRLLDRVVDLMAMRRG